MRHSPLFLAAFALAAGPAAAQVVVDTRTGGTQTTVPFGQTGEVPGNFRDDNGNGQVDEANPLVRAHTVGQTVTVPATATRLTAFSFATHDAHFTSVGEPDAATAYRAYVMAWDAVNNHVTGPVLFQSGIQSTVEDGADHTVTFSGLALDFSPGGSFVAFVTQEGFGMSSGNNTFSSVLARDSSPGGTYTGGTLVTKTDGTLSFTGLSTQSWAVAPDRDAEFSATFTAVPEPSALLLAAPVAAGWVAFWRRRWLPARATCVTLFVLGLLAAGPPAHAQVIVSDSFTGANGSPLNGRTPDGANLPGRTLVSPVNPTGVQPSIDTSAGSPAPAALTGFNSPTYMDISGIGGYAKPTRLTMTIDFQMNTIQGGGSQVRGIGLGFFSPAPAAFVDASANFTGLTVQPNGALALVIRGVQQSAGVAPIPAFSAATFYTLSYAVDTATEAITSVTFNGADETAAFAGPSGGAFSAAVTDLAGFYGDTANSVGLSGRVDNFKISSPVPEPSALALAVPAAAGWVAFWRRRWRAVAGGNSPRCPLAGD